jgi:hypothetical protein
MLNPNANFQGKIIIMKCYFFYKLHKKIGLIFLYRQMQSRSTITNINPVENITKPTMNQNLTPWEGHKFKMV